MKLDVLHTRFESSEQERDLKKRDNVPHVSYRITINGPIVQRSDAQLRPMLQHCVCVCRSTKVAMFSWLIGRCPEPKSECGNRVPLKPQQQQQQNAHHLNPEPVHCSPMPRACLSVIANRNEHTEHSMPGFLCVRVCVRVRACPSLPSWFSGSTLRCDELTAQFSCTTAVASRCVCVCEIAIVPPITGPCV